MSFWLSGLKIYVSDTHDNAQDSTRQPYRAPEILQSLWEFRGEKLAAALNSGSDLFLDLNRHTITWDHLTVVRVKSTVDDELCETSVGQRKGSKHDLAGGVMKVSIRDERAELENFSSANVCGLDPFGL
jgi:hypothetical protein